MSALTNTNDDVVNHPILPNTYLDEEDMSLLHDLKAAERPHLFTPIVSSSSNQFEKYDTPLWRRHNLAQNWEAIAEKFAEPLPGNRVEIVDAELVSSYEKQNLPCLIPNLTSTWTPQTFTTFLSTYSDLSFRFSDQHGSMLDLTTYSAYVNHPLLGLMDDSPLAIYDSEFNLTEATKSIADSYAVPPCFSKCLWEGIEAGRKPPFQWILAGPTRSGTGMHIDPVGTNAWVSLLRGLKLWVLFPDTIDVDSIGLVEKIESSVWFTQNWEKLKAGELGQFHMCLQRPGETVLVPAGWPHAVLNLADSYAITHNYACGENFEVLKRMVGEVIKEERSFAKIWFKRLKETDREVWEKVKVMEGVGKIVEEEDSDDSDGSDSDGSDSDNDDSGIH